MVSKSDREPFPSELPQPQLFTGMTFNSLSAMQSTLGGHDHDDPIKSSYSADHVRTKDVMTDYEFVDTDPRHKQEGVLTTTIDSAVNSSSGVQTSRSDSAVTVGQRSNRTSNLHHVGKELFFPIPGA